jgi:RHS repeat-associated protein
MVALATVLVLSLLCATPPAQGALPGGWPAIHLPARGSLARLLFSPSWGDLPQQQSGTAVGRGHAASAASTRANGGAGKAAGKGKGQLGPYAPYARKFTIGQSASGVRGFDARTSQRVASKSTATSSYFSNADGSFTRRLATGTVNYSDAAGSWQPIDTTLKRSSGGRWHERANSMNMQLAPAADDPALMSLAVDATHSLSYGLLGAEHVPGTVSGSEITFPGALPQTDLRLTTLATGEKEALVLHAANAASSWAFRLNLDGLTAAPAANGGIEVLNAAGKTVAVIPPGSAHDARTDRVSGEPVNVHPVSYQLKTVAGRTELVMSLDPAWLHDASRTFPVTVDPSLLFVTWTTYAESGDGWTGDHSGDQVIKIGSSDSGVHSARSFLQFPSSGIDNSHLTVTAATVDLFDIWAPTCTAEQLNVAPVTQPWTPSSVTSYPGPSLGASIGNLTPSVPNACANTAQDPSVGDDITVGLSVATFNAWAAGTSADYGLGVYASTTDALHWKVFGSYASDTSGPWLTLTYSGAVLPQVIVQSPANGYAASTLIPQLSAYGSVDPSRGVSVRYDYQIYDAGGAKVADSGLVAGVYSVPAGTLRWGQTYYWEVQAYDGTNYSPSPPWYQLTIAVPQPAITSGLSQNSGGHGFDASIGNYTTSATDAEVAAVGPALSVVRDYNSRDPRTTGGLGAGWSSVFDARAAEQYNGSSTVSTVVVTYPDGAEVGYGRNADGSFTAPQGRAATLIKLAAGYELIDKSDTTYLFSQSLGSGVYGITSIADANGRAELFAWASGNITTMTSVVSGRALHLTWSTPTGAGSAHVSTVVTDPVTGGSAATALTWTYGYAGDHLATVCPPGTSTACTQYGYDPHPSSEYRNLVLDHGVRSFWPLSETSGTTASSVVLANEGADNATYSNVTLGQTAGPLTGSAATAASFNGTSSYVHLPDLGMSASIAQSVSLWFQVPAGAPAGVLFSYSDAAIAPTSTKGIFPALYVGTDGKLMGSFWLSDVSGIPNPITTSSSVADGHWHHVLLTGSETAQTMYLDGSLVGAIAGWSALGHVYDVYGFNYLGTGYLGLNSWPDNPYTNSSEAHAAYFKGALADASFFDTALTQADATAMYQGGTRPNNLLTAVTRPSGKTFASLSYDPVSAVVNHVTDENGGSWSLAAPSATGSSQVYRSAVLGAGPLAYYRLGDTAGASQAYSEVNYASAGYGNATLGVAGRFADEPAAQFNGTSSFLQLPSGLVTAGPQSISMWFNTTHPNGVLFSYQQAALSAGSTTANYVPALYVGADGKLKGEFSAAAQITSAAAVTDGKWHQVVLAASGTGQSMYLDGALVATTTGTIASPQASGMNNDYIGAGFIGGSWGDNANAGVTAATPLYFNGTIGEVAYYRTQLSAAQVTGLTTAAQNSAGLTPMTTVNVTDPGNKTISYQYDPLNGNRMIAQIDALGHQTSYGYDTSGFLYTTTDPNGDVVTTGHDADGNVVSQTTCQNQTAGLCSTTYLGYKANTMGVDQAKGATVTASSSYVGSGWSPAALVDGNTTSVSGALGWTSGSFTAAANTPWVQVDMGSARTIDRVDLYSRTDNIGKGFPQGFTIAVSADGATWTTVATQTNYPAPTTPAPQSFGFNPTSVRYVKVTGTTLRTDGGSSYWMQFAELAALNDRPDPTAGELLTRRDGRSASATDNTYLTSYAYDAVGDLTTTTTPPVAGFPNGRTSTIVYTDGTAIPAADTGYAPAGLPYKTTSPGGATNAISFLRNGDVASTTDADGLQTRYTYDNLGRVATKTVVSDTFPAGLVTTFGYDGQDQVVSETAPAVTDRVTGAVHTPQTATVYDADGNITSQTVADTTGGDASRTHGSTYNAYDQLASNTDATNNTTTYTYDGYGNKTSETDPQGKQTTYAYDANGNLLSQVLANFTGDPVNPHSATPLTEVSRAYDPAGRLASITNAMGGTTTYTYTDDGLTATITRTDSNGTNPFVVKSDSYDAAGNLVREVTNNGATVTTNTVDAASRPTSTTSDPSGVARTTSVSYTPDDGVATSTSTDGTGATQVTSATYDPTGRLTSKSVRSDNTGHPVGWWRLNQTSGSTVTDASGTGNTAAANSGVTWTGDAATFNGTSGIVSTNGPVLNTAQSYSVSVWANLASTSTYSTAVSQGGTTVAAFYLQYSAALKAWTFISPNADVASPASYASAHAASVPAPNTWYHLVAVFNAGTGAMSLYVNGALAGTGTNTSQWNGGGPLSIGGLKLTTGTVNNFFNGSVSNVQTYQRALSGSEVSTLYGAGRSGATVASSSQVSTSWSLDQRGLPTSMTDPNGNVTSYAYDEAGRLAVTTAPTVNTEVGGGSPVPVHPVTARGYDTFGAPVESKDPDGNVITTAYDAEGRAVSQTLPNYTPPGSSTPITARTIRAYDSVGNLTLVTDPLSNKTGYLYDQLGDVAQVTAPDGGVTHYSYDNNGERLSTTDAAGAQTQATYDFLGRQLTSTVLDRYPSPTTSTATNSYAASTANPGGAWLASTSLPSGVVTSYGYNKLGELAARTDGASNTTAYRYDFLGRKTAVVAPDSTSTTVSYDQVGNPVSTSNLDASGATVTSRSATYDAGGNILSATDARNNTTTFTYDATGLLSQEIQPVTAGSSITTSFGYDAAGNRTRFTDGRTNSWIYTYNAWNKPESVIEPTTQTYPSAADRTFTTAYEADGRPASQTAPGGVSLATGYDANGNVLSQSGTGADAATATRTFGYDPNGRVTSAATTAGSSETFSYNDRGELLNAAGSAGTSSFSYNGDALMSARTDAAGTTSYTYDTADRLKTLADATTGTTLAYTYNALSQVNSIQYGAGGNNRTFGYDSLHRLTADTLKTAGGTTVASIAYGYDANGNETSKTTTGFAGSAANTYIYDQANRLTSWSNGTTSTAYGYDASGNRTQVGASVYTYDARDELTSDGTNSYSYTARGTLSARATTQGTVLSTSDAYGQATTEGTQTYAYDALGRMLTDTPASGSAISLSYTGASNTLAADSTNTYSWDPTGGLIGIGAVGGSPGAGVLAYTDAHTDVVGDFNASSTTLAGSTTYDPLGNVTSTASQAGRLGYQSGWTDNATGKVNMAARWYNPAIGQFSNKDTVSLNPVPNSVEANPFAYVDDNPLVATDPSGHGWLDSLTSAVSSTWDASTSFVSSAADWAWNESTSLASDAWDLASSAADYTWKAATHVYHSVVHRVRDAYHKVSRHLRHYYHAATHWVKRQIHKTVHAVSTAYHKTTKALKTAGTFIKHHAAAITSFVVSTAVFIGCEAVVTGLSGGTASLPGVVACGALAGAVGGLITQGAKCAGGQKGACSGGAFLKAGLVGGAVGGLAGAGGALGGKLLSAVGGRALGAVGGLFGRGGTEVAEGAATDAAAGAAEGGAESAAASGAEATGGAAETSAGETSAREGAAGERPHAGKEPKSSSCTEPHSFAGNTPILMADGTSKPIDQVKVGDRVQNSVPGQSGDQAHTVQRVIVTTSDHDFVDVTVAPVGGSASAAHGSAARSTLVKPGRLKKAVLTVAAAATVATGIFAPAASAAEGDSGAATDLAAHGATLTTTFHHPFYDQTQAAFVDAENLRVADTLQTPTGAAVVTGVHLYYSTQTTYDLTIDGLHTYYVMAGAAPVLVHNNNGVCDVPTLKGYAKQIREAGDHPASVNQRTIAVGQDEAGNLTAGSSNGFDSGQREVADSLGIRRVPTLADQHAEENLLSENEGSMWPLKRVGTDARDPCGPTEHNCAQQLTDLGIEH